MGLAVPEVVSGLRVALNYAQEQLESLCVYSVDLEKLRDEAAVATAIKASIMSKQFGFEDFISQLVAKACVSTLPTGTDNTQNKGLLQLSKNGSDKGLFGKNSLEKVISESN